MDLVTLMSKVNKYKQIQENTINYRKAWKKEVRPLLLSTLKETVKQIELVKADVILRDNIENLEAVILDLGKSSSGISENLEDSGVKRTMIKSNGSLIYQQLFNGKIMVMIVSPNIEGYGQPKPPATIEILRPDELKPALIVRHMEALIIDITEWEDYDDEETHNVIGFNPPIGYNTQTPEEQAQT